ncbi:hypothetical protein AHAS_Ahas13G0333300 [Arachis hypogaea]
MAYFSVVPNQGGYRATEHEFKLIFLHRTTVAAVSDDLIPTNCFTIYPFEIFFKMNAYYDYLVDVIGLLISVGEEKEYAKEGKIVKMIVIELSFKDLTLRCALFGEYANQINHFLASGYMEQPVVLVQLAKVKFFRGCYSTQPLIIANEGKIISLEDDFMRLTRRCTIEDLQDINEEGSFIIFGIIRYIVEEGPWWYSTCVCGKAIQPQGGVYYCDFCVHHVTNVTPRFRIKISVEDQTGDGIFVLFDREASYLLKKSCAEIFTEVQKDASVICGDTHPIMFKDFIGKKVLLKVDTKPVGVDKYFGTFRVRRVYDDVVIIAMFELPNYDADDEATPHKVSSYL